MPTRVPVSALIVAVVLASSGCGKSTTAPKPPPELPNDPNPYAPAFSFVKHFQADTQWVELSPTTDDVEVNDINLHFQMDPDVAWLQMGTRVTGGPIVSRFGPLYIEVVSPRFPRAPYASTLTLNVRRTPYRTWFRTKVF